MNFVLLITACFHALLLSLPFIFTWVNSELFEFNKMLAVYGFAVIIGGLWLTRMVFERRFIWQRNPASLLVLIFLAGQAAATVFSIHFHTSLLGFYSRLNGGFFSSLAYSVLFLALINNVPKKQTLSLLLTAVVGGLLAAFYALPEHFGASPSCLLIQGQFDVACWKQDVQDRVFGTFGQPNWLATYLVGLLPVSWFFSQKQTGWQKKFWLVAVGVMLLVLWFTKSRSGLVAASAAGLTWAALQYRQVWWRKLRATLRSRWLRLAAGVGALVLLIAGGVLIGRAIPAAEGGESFDLSQGTESGSIRLIVWRGAIKVWQRYPLLGSGPGTFAYSYYQDRPVEHNLVSEWNFLYNKAHNEFLNYLAETGLVGLLTYLVFLGGLFYLLQQQLPKNSQQASLAQAVTASLVGLTVAHFFGFSTVTSNLLLFLLPAIVLLIDDDLPKKLRPRRLWQKLAQLGIVLAALFLLWQIGRFWQADWQYAQAKKFQESLEYSQAVTALQQAIKLQPKEATYYDELANLYSKLALEYWLANKNEASQQLTEAAIQNSDFALLLNPRHLNFYKTRVRVFFILAQIDKQYFGQAEQVLQIAIELSPTDAQLWYNLGLTQQEEGKFDAAVRTLQHTVEIKPDYVRARAELGDLLVGLGQVEAGKEQYRFILEKLSPNDEETKAKLDALETSAREN
jgi:tetratricopeptide (TPR) repeat protein